MIVGSWELEAPVGAGAMASVWRAHHRSNRTAGAVKLIEPVRGQGVRWTVDLLNEARILAAVDHPNVIGVLDYGMTEQPIGQVPAGSVWIATELAERSLAGVPLDWPQLHDVLRQVLTGLARAHALGIVHRDIKPGNILQFHGKRGSSWKLADFGLALRRGLEAEGVAGGTPGFMAPEQISGELAEQGPWTDLYAVGCMGWMFATGAGPHEAGDVQDTLRSHLRGLLPSFAPRFEVPEGLEGWLRRLLHPVPTHRLRRAADALVLLREVSQGAMRPGVAADLAPNDAISQAETLLPSQEFLDAGPEPTVDLPEAEAIELPDPLTLHGDALERARTLPSSPPPSDRSAALSRVRATSLVGRGGECGALWLALGDTIRNGTFQVVAIHGASGLGRTRLARWLQVHAHESGLAEPFVAPTGGDRLGGLVRAALGLPTQPTRAQVHRRIASRAGLGMDPVLTRALVEHAVGEADGEATELLTPALATLADGRAALVVFDDAEDDPDVLAWIRRSANWTGTPVLVVVCLTDGTPGTPETLQELESLGARRLSLGPLDVDSQSELLRQRFGLAPVAAAVAARHAGGVPALAVDLVEAWWQRNLLRRGPGGWTADDLDALDISMEITDAWRNRIAELFEGRGADARVSVAIAAMLGSQITEEHWVAACLALGAEPSWPAMLGLAEQDYVQRDEAGWTWRSEPARLALRRVLTSGDRAEAAAACVSVLDPEVTPIRCGQLLIEAGRPEEALPMLIEAGRTAQRDRRHTAALAAFDAVALARKQLGRDPYDDEGLEAMLLRGSVEFRMGRSREARKNLNTVLERVAGRRDALQAMAVQRAASHLTQIGEGSTDLVQQLQDVVERLRAQGDLQQLSDALNTLAIGHAELGDLDAAIAAMQEAMAIRPTPPSGHDEKQLGALLARRGRLQEALVLLRSAKELTTDRPRAQTEACSLLGHVLDRLGDPEAGRAEMVQAYELSVTYGETLQAADSLNNIAELDRRAGRLDQAEAGYLESLELYRRVGATIHPILVVNLALVYVERGSWEQAWEVFSGCIDDLREQGRTGWLGVAIGLALPAVHDRPGLWDAMLRERRALLEASGHSDRDCVRMLLLSAERWGESGDADRRERALRAALYEARSAGMPDLIEQIEAMLPGDQQGSTSSVTTGDS